MLLGESGPQGLIVEDKHFLQSPIRSLLRKGLIQQGAYHLTEAGAHYFSSLPTKRRTHREEDGRASRATAPSPTPLGTEDDSEMGAGVALEAEDVAHKAEDVDFEEAVDRGLDQPWTPTEGAMVSLIDSGRLEGRIGRVKYVNGKEKKACVCLEFSDDYWIPKTFDFVKLEKSEAPIKDCSCKDCKDLRAG